MTQIVTDIYANPPVAWFLVDIWFVMPPNKIVYKSGESFDPTGLQVQAIYNNNLREMVTNYTYYPTGALVDGDKTVTISYTDGEITKTRGITITVQPILVGVEVTTMPTKTVYTYGETPDYTGMVVTATYSDGTSAEVTGYTTTNTTLSTLGSVGLTVSYTEDGITFTDDVPITVGPATIATVPTQSGSLTYNGNAQSPTWSGYDSNQLTLEGSISEANAGTYTVSFTPKYGFCWVGGGDSTQSTTWSISKAQIGSMPAQNGSLTYNGSAQIPTWSNYDTSQLTMDGNTSGTNAGTYTVSFTPTANYMWSDSTTEAKNATWSIGKATTIITVTPNPIEITAENNPINISISSTRGLEIGGMNVFADTTILELLETDNLDDGTIIYKFLGKENGNGQIRVDMPESGNFLAAELIVPVTVSLSSYTRLLYIENPNLGYIENVPNLGQIKLKNLKIIYKVSKPDYSSKQELYPYFGTTYIFKSGTQKKYIMLVGLFQYISNKNYVFRQGAKFIYNSIYTNNAQTIYTSNNTPTIVLDFPNQIVSVTDAISSISLSWSATEGSAIFSDYVSGCTLFGETLWDKSYNTKSEPQFGQNPSNFQLYFLEVYDCSVSANTPIYNYVPCITPDGLVGVHELINNTYHSSANSNKPFVAGPAV